MPELAKTHILFPVDLLKKIDRIAGVGFRSQFVIHAAEEKLARDRFVQVLKRTAGTWSERRHPKMKSQRHLNQFLKKGRRQTSKRLALLHHG